MSLEPDELIYQNNSEALLKELISQRLIQGYQLIISEEDSSRASEPAKKISYYLSLGHNYQKITFDKNDQNIEVKVTPVIPCHVNTDIRKEIHSK